jgi:hypothetical protein
VGDHNHGATNPFASLYTCGPVKSHAKSAKHSCLDSSVVYRRAGLQYPQPVCDLIRDPLKVSRHKAEQGRRQGRADAEVLRNKLFLFPQATTIGRGVTGPASGLGHYVNFPHHNR